MLEPHCEQWTKLGASSVPFVNKTKMPFTSGTREHIWFHIKTIDALFLMYKWIFDAWEAINAELCRSTWL